MVAEQIIERYHQSALSSVGATRKGIRTVLEGPATITDLNFVAKGIFEKVVISFHRNNCQIMAINSTRPQGLAINSVGPGRLALLFSFFSRLGGVTPQGRKKAEKQSQPPRSY